ncbi:hypothetical protein K227x_50290 [Rubripirellula lacrimiformis]|uniref:DUF1598 domain-containing protein n=1 Tax=Rubripirellula lacrimiformis TaxID=1930273 RepID=A0A517NHR7_9BACT|nr:DUF1598 domain-containing protein [Rubripirellula lacrimiformis]QDT06618.1 hypothetical protein K227x_50290 [Rubripirellula lacrimiformis]
MNLRKLVATGSIAIACCTLVCLSATRGMAEDVASHLAAGEFAAAAAMVGGMPADRQPIVLAEIASSQSSSGELAGAESTIRSMNAPAARQQAIDDIRAAGGASFANFDSLIDLIQTTVVPDTWDLLGGPSSMKEYSQGVYVDPEGTVHACETVAASDELENLKVSLLAGRTSAVPDADRWRMPSQLRCVSLRRLLDESNRRRFSGTPLSAAMLHTAGLSDVRFVFLDPRGDDIVIAGQVGGIESVDGVLRDRVTTQGALRMDFLITSLASVLSGQKFGCTIDPTTVGLQRSAAVAADVQADRIPIGKSADALMAALGMQRVEVFGTPGDTSIGYLMVEADRHMKQLALGVHPMPENAMNYLDVTDATIDRGAPNGLLLRLWFTASPRSVRADAERTIFEIAGSPIRLSGENERAMADGARGNLTKDFRTEMFVADFNQHFDDIRSKYPVYGSLEAIYQAASVSELLRRSVKTPGHHQLIAQWASTSSSSVSSATMPTPRQVESIAVLHRVRHARQIHHVLIASGGVAVNASATLVGEVANYPSLSSMANVPTDRPRVVQNWWWDAR